jgi:hypothetical protein
MRPSEVAASAQLFGNTAVGATKAKLDIRVYAEGENVLHCVFKGVDGNTVAVTQTLYGKVPGPTITRNHAGTRTESRQDFSTGTAGPGAYSQLGPHILECFLQFLIKTHPYDIKTHPYKRNEKRGRRP